MVRKSFFITLLFAIVFVLPACGGSSTTSISISVEQLPELKNSNVIIRQDEDKLVQVRIVDVNGERHDIKKLIDYSFLLGNAWICKLYPATGGKFIYGVLRFEQDGTVRYEE